MVEINWSLLQSANVGNAFNEGLETGRKRRQEEKTRSVLADIATNWPGSGGGGALGGQTGIVADPQADEARFNELITPLAQLAPMMAIKIREMRNKTVYDGREQQATRQKAIDAKLADGKKAVGQVALQIANLPPQQQAQAWDQGIDYLVGQGYDGLAQFKGKYSPESLRGVLAESGLAAEYQSATKPSYMAIPEGGTLVNTRDPDAVAQFGSQQPPTSGPARVTAQSEYQSLPPGAEYIAPDGSLRRKGGAPSQGGATFP